MVGYSFTLDGLIEPGVDKPMIAKLEGMQNGYALMRSSTDKEFQRILKRYKDNNNLKCIICNERTARCFKHDKVLSDPPVTINNKMLSGIFYINGIF